MKSSETMKTLREKVAKENGWKRENDSGSAEQYDSEMTEKLSNTCMNGADGG